jgi:hypothetical protein
VGEIVGKYRSLGIRNEYLDKFEGIFLKNRTILEFCKFPMPDTYADFRKLCENSP